MAKKKVAVVGANGRMGREIIGLLENNDQLSFHQGLDREGVGYVSRFEDLDGADIRVLIDFSLPELMSSVCKFCIDNNVPLVSGTTGINSEHKAALEETSQKVAVLWAPNMSLGVAFVHKLLENYKAIANEFDFQIEEFHHIHKKDKPSGTAIYLQEQLQKQVNNKAPEPLAIRGGGIFGIHKIWAMSEQETILLEHTALNRQVFAKGAVKAAEWLVDKKPGMYTIADVLGM